MKLNKYYISGITLIIFGFILIILSFVLWDMSYATWPQYSGVIMVNASYACGFGSLIIIAIGISLLFAGKISTSNYSKIGKICLILGIIAFIGFLTLLGFPAGFCSTYSSIIGSIATLFGLYSYIHSKEKICIIGIILGFMVLITGLIILSVEFF